MRKAARMHNLASTQLGPQITWFYRGVGDVSFNLDIRFRPPQTFF